MQSATYCHGYPMPRAMGVVSDRPTAGAHHEGRKRLGHAELRMRRRYSPLAPVHTRAAMENVVQQGPV